jgi:hypothetical protein
MASWFLRTSDLDLTVPPSLLAIADVRHLAPIKFSPSRSPSAAESNDGFSTRKLLTN